jgi:hypothetical protein
MTDPTPEEEKAKAKAEYGKKKKKSKRTVETLDTPEAEKKKKKTSSSSLPAEEEEEEEGNPKIFITSDIPGKWWAAGARERNLYEKAKADGGKNCLETLGLYVCKQDSWIYTIDNTNQQVRYFLDIRGQGDVYAKKLDTKDDDGRTVYEVAQYYPVKNIWDHVGAQKWVPKAPKSIQAPWRSRVLFVSAYGRDEWWKAQDHQWEMFYSAKEAKLKPGECKDIRLRGVEGQVCRNDENWMFYEDHPEGRVRFFLPGSGRDLVAVPIKGSAANVFRVVDRRSKGGKDTWTHAGDQWGKTKEKRASLVAPKLGPPEKARKQKMEKKKEKMVEEEEEETKTKKTGLKKKNTQKTKATRKRLDVARTPSSRDEKDSAM